MALADSGRLARSVMATQCLTVFVRGATAAISGKKVRSKKRIWSSAWSAIHTTWSGCSRGFTVCSTDPMPDTPKYSSMCR